MLTKPSSLSPKVEDTVLVLTLPAQHLPKKHSFNSSTRSSNCLPHCVVFFAAFLHPDRANPKWTMKALNSANRNGDLILSHGFFWSQNDKSMWLQKDDPLPNSCKSKFILDPVLSQISCWMTRKVSNQPSVASGTVPKVNNLSRCHDSAWYHLVTPGNPFFWTNFELKIRLQNWLHP